ncbi:MAG: recombinase RecT [Nitrospira sp.]|nr:recombinase RecT [Nitrospira sp.]
MGNDLTTARSVSVSLNITTLESLQAFCAVLAGTEMVPKAYRGKPDDILVAMLHGQEVGLPHLQALQSIAVVNGVPSIYGDAALALVRASGKIEDFDEWIEVDGKRQEGPFPILKYAEEERQIVAYCMSKRVGMSRPRTTTFSVDDAQRAKLWLKVGQSGFETPWCTVPQRMLMWRARGWNLRDNFGDVLKGLAIYEEAMDFDTVKDARGTYKVAEDVGGEETAVMKDRLLEGQEKLKQQQLAPPTETAKTVETPTEKPKQQQAQPKAAPKQAKPQEDLTMSQARLILRDTELAAEIATVMNWMYRSDLTEAERKEIMDLKEQALTKMKGKAKK